MTMFKKIYSNPECDIVILNLSDILCTSPVEGGLEGTSDEDWVI